jgi:ribonuclease HI/probable phosphoglycerate mutase
LKRDKLESLISNLKKKGASKRPLADADMSDADCRELAKRLEALLPKEPVVKKPSPGVGKGRAQLYCDGACRGNPGPSSFGYVILVDDVEVAAEGRTLGRMTNNQAEYLSLKAGLIAAKELGLLNLAIFMDSELVVRQVTGRYKVKNEGLKPLFAEVILQLRGFKDWNIRHVPRAENARADALANEALDSV